MASSVTVLVPGGRRATVKIEPHTTFLEILEQVCQKYNLNPAAHNLKHHNKILDLTTMFSFSGTPNNAALEMIAVTENRIETDVKLAIKLEEGTDLEGTFSPSTSLLTIMKTLCADKANVQSNPVLVYMRRKVLWGSMENTTLRSLGLTGGRAILRLFFEKPGEPIEQAHVSAPLPQKIEQDKVDTSQALEMEFEPSTVVENREEQSGMDGLTESKPSSPSSSKKSKPSVDNTEPTPSTSATKSIVSQQTQSETLDTIEEPTEESIIYVLGDREAIVYHIETAKRSSFEVPDSFYEVTAAEVLKMQNDLRNKIKEYENAPLMTSELRKLENSKREMDNLKGYKIAVVRVKFPDGYVLQGIFKIHEKIADVMTFVRNYLEDQSLDFHLYTTPPKQILSDDIDLVMAKCVPQALIHFGCSQDTDVTNYLKVNIYDQLSNAYGASVAAARSRDLLCEEVPAAASESDVLNTIQDNQQKYGDNTAAGASNRMPNTNFRLSSVQTPTSSTKVPKWFKPTTK